MSHSKRPLDLVEYIWPCGYHENVSIKPAPAIPFVPVDFPLPLSKPVDQFTESEKRGIPAFRRCCKCGGKYHIFQIPDGCKLCSHSFRDPCSTCTIIGFCGLHEIATVELKPTGEFDQTPEYWRCGRCEDINPFESRDAFLTPKRIRCKRCFAPFHESNWVISPFHVYLGSWDGRIVAESGPWHWSLTWHQDMPVERAIQHGEEGCYGRRDNGRRRRAIPWIGKMKSTRPWDEDSDAGNTVHIPKKSPALPLPTPRQSRPMSPSRHPRVMGASLAAKRLLQPAAVMIPHPLLSSHSTQGTSNTPRNDMSKLKPTPQPGIEWNTRPLPPLPPIPKDVKAHERGRSQTRRVPSQDLIRDHRPGRLQLETKNNHQERGRSHELRATPGGFDDVKNIRPSKSQVFQGSTSTHTYTLPPIPSMPTVELSTIPKIAIQPDTPAVERARMASAAASYPRRNHSNHKRARSLSIVAPARVPSTQPLAAKTPSRTPPRYSLFPSASSSRPATPDYHRRPSVPVNHSRPTTASGYTRGHSRSRSEGHPPGTAISRADDGQMVFEFPRGGGDDTSKEYEGGNGGGGGGLHVQGVQNPAELPVSGWYGDEQDGEGEGEGEDEGGAGGKDRSRSHSRRRTLAHALKPRNWF